MSFICTYISSSYTHAYASLVSLTESLDNVCRLASSLILSPVQIAWINVDISQDSDVILVMISLMGCWISSWSQLSVWCNAAFWVHCTLVLPVYNLCIQYHTYHRGLYKKKKYSRKGDEVVLMDVWYIDGLDLWSLRDCCTLTYHRILDYIILHNSESHPVARLATPTFQHWTQALLTLKQDTCIVLQFIDIIVIIILLWLCVL